MAGGSRLLRLSPAGDARLVLDIPCTSSRAGTFVFCARGIVSFLFLPNGMVPARRGKHEPSAGKVGSWCTGEEVLPVHHVGRMLVCAIWGELAAGLQSPPAAGVPSWLHGSGVLNLRDLHYPNHPLHG